MPIRKCRFPCAPFCTKLANSQHHYVPVSYTELGTDRAINVESAVRYLLTPRSIQKGFYSASNLDKVIFFAVALRPNAGHGLLFLEVSRSHTTMHHSRQDSSGRVISSSQGPLLHKTQHSQQTNIHDPGGIRTHDLSRRAAGPLAC